MERETVMSEQDSNPTASGVATHGVIDRIEDNEMAVVLLGDEEDIQVDLPLSLLPAEATGGDHLRITIELDHESRDTMADKIRAMQEKLLNRAK
jgi:hypothetical protein